jgi:hypothetical protein
MENVFSPWGPIITQQELGEGILWVETAEHGGLLIDMAQAHTLLSAQALKIGTPWKNLMVYEQERDMPVVLYEHPELYPWVEEELTQKLAADCLRRLHPTYFVSALAGEQTSAPLADILGR